MGNSFKFFAAAAAGRKNRADKDIKTKSGHFCKKVDNAGGDRRLKFSSPPASARLDAEMSAGSWARISSSLP